MRKTVKAFRELVPFPSVGGTAPAFIPGIDWSDHSVEALLAEGAAGVVIAS